MARREEIGKYQVIDIIIEKYDTYFKFYTFMANILPNGSASV